MGDAFPHQSISKMYSVPVNTILFVISNLFDNNNRCVYTEYDEIFRAYGDVGYETVIT